MQAEKTTINSGEVRAKLKALVQGALIVLRLYPGKSLLLAYLKTSSKGCQAQHLHFVSPRK